MGESRSPIDRVADVFVYAPVGIALQVSKALPDLAEAGRAKLAGPLTAARFVGEHFVRQHQDEVVEHLRKAVDWAADSVADVARTVVTRTDQQPPDAEQRTQRPDRRTDDYETHEGDTGAEAPYGASVRDVGGSVATTSSSAPSATDKASSEERAASASGAPRGGELAIPGYTSLSASQVVAHLDGLSRSELLAIRDHESRTRRRRTILARIEQLIGSTGGTS